MALAIHGNICNTESAMHQAKKSASAKKIGRPSTGQTPVMSLRLPPELRARITAWIAASPDPEQSLSAAIIALIRTALDRA